MANNDSGDYEVGRGKPPRDTQFKKGQSGNPRGRPRGSRNLRSLIKKELRELIIVNENGRQKELTKREAMVKRLVNSALAGDRKLLPYLVEYEGAREAQEETTRSRKAPKLKEMSRPEFSREVLRILMESGEIREEDYAENAPASADNAPVQPSALALPDQTKS